MAIAEDGDDREAPFYSRDTPVYQSATVGNHNTNCYIVIVKEKVKGKVEVG